MGHSNDKTTTILFAQIRSILYELTLGLISPFRPILGRITYTCTPKKLGLLDREACFVFKVKVSELYHTHVKASDHVYITYRQAYQLVPKG